MRFRTCRRSPNRACPAMKRPPGTACSRLRARQPARSSACMATSSGSWRNRTSATGWRLRASTRSAARRRSSAPPSGPRSPNGARWSATPASGPNDRSHVEREMRDKLFEQGLRVRKQVLGAAYVDKQFSNADAFSLPMQVLATKSAWGMVWSRPGLPRKVRSMLNIAMLVALGRAEELELHLDGALRNGVTKKEIGEVLLQSAIYCGYPAALGGFRTAREYFAKHEKPRQRKK